MTLEGRSGIRSHKTGQAFLGVICMDVENVFVCVNVTYVSLSIYCTHKIYHLYLLQFITILTNITESNFHQKYLMINKKINKMSDLVVVFYVIIKQYKI